MSGVVASIASSTPNVIYSAGLYNSSLGVDASPITFSASSSGGSSLNYNYTWTGYYRPASTGSVTLGLATSYIEYIDYFGSPIQYNWGGGGYSTAYLWLGSTAVSGYTTGNANITSSNGTATYSPSLIAGQYYPVRINLLMYLPYNPIAYAGFYAGWASGAFNFQSSSSTDVTNLIWYNRLSNGF